MMSFVMATRNDGYGGTIEGIENFAMRRLEITVESLLTLGNMSFPWGEIIVVDWNPPADRASVAEVLGTNQRIAQQMTFPSNFDTSHPYVRVLRVSGELQARLDADKPDGKPLPFYEYVAKEIGIRAAKHDEIIACNPDNIFPIAGFPEHVVDEMDDGVYVRAVRHEIASDAATLDTASLLYLCETGYVPEIRTFDNAAGDFSGFTRRTYRELGGYAMVHGNWHVDGNFTERARAAGLRIVQEYSHYHIRHDFSGSEATGRSKDFANYGQIDPDITAALMDYVTEE